MPLSIAQWTSSFQMADDSPKPERDERGRWLPGCTANPGGKTRDRLNTMAKARQIAQKHCDEAIAFLVSVMRNPDALESSRVACAREILDRGLGRPTQMIEGDGSLIVKVLHFAEQWDCERRAEIEGEAAPLLLSGDDTVN